MSDIEKEKFRQIGIDLINEYRKQRGIRLLDWLVIDTPEESAFIRSIQLHENTKKELQDVKQELADFKQKVSDTVGDTLFMVETHCDGEAVALVSNRLLQFIIPKPKRDPMTEVWRELFANEYNLYEFIAAMDARGLEIREKGQ